MQIRVKLMGVLKSQTPAGNILVLPANATIEAALQALDIPIASVQVFTLNGQLERNKTRTLSNNDELSVLPPVGGG